jgi:hypothetical protein
MNHSYNANALLSYQNQNRLTVSDPSLFVTERNSKFDDFKILGHPLPHDLLFRATQGAPHSWRYDLYLMLRAVSESSVLLRLMMISLYLLRVL